MRRRSHAGSRHPVVSAVLTICIAALGLVVLWQLGHGFVLDEDAAPAGDGRPEAAFFTTSEVNLRSGPGIDHEVLAVLPPKTSVAVTGEQRDGFAPVRADGLRAWIATDYILPEGSVLAATEHIPLAAMPTDEPTAAPTVVPTEAPMQETIAGSTEAPAMAPAVADEAVPAGERWISIDRGARTVTLHHGDAVVGVYDALIGKDPSQDGYYATAVGTFHVFVKTRELTETPFAPGSYLTDFVGFDPARSNGIHSPVRDAAGDVVATGGTETLGCVRLSEEAARTVFDFAEIGMRVEVHD